MVRLVIQTTIAMLLLGAQTAAAGEGMRGRIRTLDPRQAPLTPQPIEPPPVNVETAEIPSAAPGAAATDGLIDSGSAAAPGEAAVRAERRTVTIASDPPGAAVWVDGRERGLTPLKVQVSPSSRVVLIRAGFRTARVPLEQARDARIEQTLVRAAPAGGPTGVRVECRTAGRYPIMINDQDTGLLCPSTPSGRISLPPGTHTVGLYLPEKDQLVQKQVMLEETVRSLKFRK